MTATKSALRERALRVRRGLDAVQLAELSARVARNLYCLHEFQGAKTIATYVAKEREVQTLPLIERALRLRKRVIVPRTAGSAKQLLFFEIRGVDDLSPGTFGVLEPLAAPGSRAVPLGESDIVLVPLLAWDDRGNRIGYGKGYFDSTLPSRGPTPAVGLALEAQHVARIPASSSDAALDIVVTEDRVIRFAERGRGQEGRD